MSRRYDRSSEFSLTDSVKGLARTVASYTSLPVQDDFMRDPGASKRLSHHLSTRTAISTTSTLAREYALASENPETVRLVEIGSGQCGTVFAVLGTEEVLKLPNSEEKHKLLYEDAVRHADVYAAFKQITSESFEISVPQLGCWMNEKFSSRHAYNAALPPQFQNMKYGIISQRIFPLPLPTRKAIIDTFCPLRLLRQVNAEPRNKDCLVRVYLGRRDETKRKAESRFSLRNFPLLVNDMELLNLDTSMYARTMGFALAVMHWQARVDGNDVEFVIGSKPFKRQIPVPIDFTGLDMDDAQHAKYDIDFRKRTNHLWLLDFNECSSFELSDADDSSAEQIKASHQLIIDKLGRAFWFNDPYYPRPGLTHPEDQRLWTAFSQTYISTAEKITVSKLPYNFIEAVEAEGAARSHRMALQSGDSLFGSFLR